MNNSIVNVRGSMINDFQKYVENKTVDPESRYQAVSIEEERDYGTGKTAGTVEIILLVLGIAQDLVKDLFKDYLKDLLKRKVHSMKYKLKNEKGEELEITLNGLTMEEVEIKLESFTGNITEISSE